MGNIVKHMWWGGNPDLPNEFSGLTKRDIHNVQKSWQIVYSNPVPNGTELLKRFFKAYPHTKNYFKIIKELPEGEYEKHPQFQAHVMNLMNSLNTAVSSLNNPEIVAALMNKLGESHGRRNIQEQDYHDLKNVIVQMFIEVLNLDEDILGSWGKVVTFWYKHIFETLKQNHTS